MKVLSRIVDLYCETQNKTVVLENELVYKMISNFLQQLS